MAALFDSELPANGYEVTRKIDSSVKQWQFAKDGRQGTVNLEENPTATLITINLFVEGAHAAPGP